MEVRLKILYYIIYIIILLINIILLKNVSSKSGKELTKCRDTEIKTFLALAGIVRDGNLNFHESFAQSSSGLLNKIFLRAEISPVRLFSHLYILRA